MSLSCSLETDLFFVVVVRMLSRIVWKGLKHLQKGEGPPSALPEMLFERSDVSES